MRGVLPSTEAIAAQLDFGGHRPPLRRVAAFKSCGMDATAAVAGNDRDPALGVAGRRTIENETAMGFLDLFAQQRALGRLGMEGSGLRVDRSPIRPRPPEHPRRREKRTRLMERGDLLDW